MERKIGDVIEYDGQKFQVMKGICENCYFMEKSFLECAEVVENYGNCELEGLVYPIDIYYKLVEE